VRRRVRGGEEEREEREESERVREEETKVQKLEKLGVRRCECTSSGGEYWRD
jgi:hypothetical protein